MSSKQNIIITIGSYGAVVSFHNKGVVTNKIFLEELNEDSKKEIATTIEKHKSYPIYLLLDTVDQSYKQKSYPSVRKGDLNRLIKRDALKDGDNSSLKNYIILNANENKPSLTKKASDNRWDCLFVSASISDSATPWIDLIDSLPNRLIGIYLLPIESFSFFNLLKKDILSKSKIKEKTNDLFCLVIETKVNGFRQIIFSDSGIVFTRVVSYRSSDPDFAEKYDQDIHSTIEYLKRIYPDLTLDELDIVNIFSQNALDSLEKSNLKDLNAINYTPHQVAITIGNPNLVSKKASTCDLLLADSFTKTKKLLKFSLAKIDAAEQLFLMLRSALLVNAGLIIAILVSSIIFFFSIINVNNKIEEAKNNRTVSSQKLKEIQSKALEGIKLDSLDESVTLETITDFGALEELLSQTEIDFIDLYIKLKFLKDFKVQLNAFNFNLNNFNKLSPSKNPRYSITFKGNMKNESGDIEDLFTEFDNLVAEVKKEFSGFTVTYPQLPRNIDFNQKYHSFPVNFSIIKK